MLGRRCGQTGLNLSEVRTPSHGDGARVGLNLKNKQEEKFSELSQLCLKFSIS